MATQLSDVFPDFEKENKEDLLHSILVRSYHVLRDTKGKHVLRVLFRNHPEPISLNKLQIEMGISQYKLYEELARLEGTGFISKKADSSDRRIVNVSMSPAGLYVMERSEEIK